MNAIDALFEKLHTAKRRAFMPFLTAGDPDLAFTEAALPALAQSGASLIEVGFPYSDPIADGPVIQASYTRALAQGLHVAEIFEAIQSLSEPGRVGPECAGGGSGPTRPGSHRVPLVAMVAYAIIFRHGSA